MLNLSLLVLLNQKPIKKASHALSLGSHGKPEKSRSSDECKAIGNQVSRQGGDNTNGGDRPDQSKTHSGLRMVQQASKGGVVAYLPTNTGEPSIGLSSPNQPGLASVAEPLVGIYDGRAAATNTKETDLEALLAGRYYVNQTQRGT